MTKVIDITINRTKNKSIEQTNEKYAIRTNNRTNDEKQQQMIEL